MALEADPSYKISVKNTTKIMVLNLWVQAENADKNHWTIG